MHVDSTLGPTLSLRICASASKGCGRVTYLVKRVFWAFKRDVPEEQIIVVLKSDARSQIVIVLDICVEEFRISFEVKE